MEPIEESLSDETKTNLVEEDVGSIWSYKGNDYEITGLLSFKDPHDARWYQAVMYKPLDNSVEMPYGRYESDFLSKFKPAPKGNI